MVRTTHADSQSHIAMAWDKCGLRGRSHAFIGNGNLLSNPHFIGYRNSLGDKHRLYTLLSEPYAERTYSCLVVWRDFNIGVVREVKTDRCGSVNKSGPNNRFKGSARSGFRMVSSSASRTRLT